MGWGFLLTLGGLLAGNVKKYIDDKDMMSEPYRYLDDGTPVYLDSSCKEHINGEKVIKKYDYQNKKLIEVGEITGNVYFDPKEAKKKRMNAQSEKYKQEAIKDGKKAYLKYNFERNKFITCEIETDKFIVQLQGKSDGTYWKYYLNPEATHYHSASDEDIGIEITQEDYDKLNIYNGTHRARDLYRYTPVFRNGRVIYEPNNRR